MKNQAGIDLSHLTEAQRKMYIRLLAINDVQFKEDKDSYIATLTVPNSDLNNYLKGYKENLKDRKEQRVKNAIKDKQGLKEKTNGRGRNMSKSPSALTTKKQKQGNKVMGSKKPLFKAVKLPVIAQLEQLHPEIEIYVYAKRLALPVLQQQIEAIYQHYWQASKDGEEVSFLKIFYEITCPYSGSANKSKNDQSLINFLESVNHFQHKEMGVKLFHMFLAGKYSREQLSYFMVLRVLLEQLVGEKIIGTRTKPNTPGNTFSTSTLSQSGRPKLKWNPFQKQLNEATCFSFLKITLPSNKNIDETFEKLTHSMYYCETKKGNFITYYDLMEFMLGEFDRQCVEDSVANLELSYSNNDSTLKDILVESGHRSFEKPLRTKFEIELVKESYKEESQVEEAEIFDNGRILLEAAIEKAREMCNRVQISAEREKEIVERVCQCVESIRTMDKIKWVQAMELEGNEQELNFIQEVQMQYRNICKTGGKLTMVNNLVRRIFGGPGFIRIFSSSISF